MSTTVDYTTVRLNRNLIVQVKSWAARHGITISDAVSQLVSAGLEADRTVAAADSIARAKAVAGPPPAKETLQSMGVVLNGVKPEPLRAMRVASDVSEPAVAAPSTYRMKQPSHDIVDTHPMYTGPMADLAAAIELLTDTVRALPQVVETKPGSGVRAAKTG